MEYKLNQTSVGILKTCIDTVSEQPVDLDFILPDYCPDIEKILRCKITPKIYNKHISGGQIQVDGTTVVTILYVDGEKNHLRACEQTVPFTATFQCKDIGENNAIEITTKAEYINCRALSQRRLAIHGAFSLYVKGVELDNTHLYHPDENEKIECDVRKIKVTALNSLSQSQFSVCDEISISNKPNIEAILTSDVKANITEYKVVSEKLMLKGELWVKLLYLSNIEKGDLQQLDYILPFSQIIDCVNLKEEDIIKVSMNLMCFDMHLKNDVLGENPLISLDAKISVTTYGYTEIEPNIINDAYSTEIVTEIEKNTIPLFTDLTVLKDTFMLKESLSLEDIKISEICEMGCDNIQLTPTLSGDTVTLNGKINVSVLALDQEKIPLYFERSIDITKEIQGNFSANTVLDSEFEVVSMSYRLGEENNLELRCEIKYSIMTGNKENFVIVSKIIGNEDNPIRKNKCALTLYYAQIGENLWDIAKSYNTKVDMIYEENNLENNVLENQQMLLIPIV